METLVVTGVFGWLLGVFCGAVLSSHDSKDKEYEERIEALRKDLEKSRDSELLQIGVNNQLRKQVAELESCINDARCRLSRDIGERLVEMVETNFIGE